MAALSRRNKILLFSVFVLAAVVVCIQLYFNQRGTQEPIHSAYNNYLIFKQSAFHLFKGQNLYDAYPQEHYDYYKYSPTFALLFAPLAILPDFAGLLLWNMLNAVLLLVAMLSLNGVSGKVKMLFMIFLVVDLVTSMQNSQSNALTAALVVLAYSSMKKDRYFLSCLLISIGVMIKIYAGVAFIFIFLAADWRRFFLAAVVTMATLALLPVFVTGFSGLFWQYQNWAFLLSWDFNDSLGISLAGICDFVVPADAYKLYIQLAGLLLLLFSVWIVRKKEARYQLSFLSFILVWMVMFNHKAESPTFVIALTGATIWIMNNHRNKIYLACYVLAFVFGCLSSTDIFPPDLRVVFLNIKIKAIAYLPLMAAMLHSMYSNKEVAMRE